MNTIVNTQARASAADRGPIRAQWVTSFLLELLCAEDGLPDADPLSMLGGLPQRSRDELRELAREDADFALLVRRHVGPIDTVLGEALGPLGSDYDEA
jgi:hypothetical protein